MITGIGVDDAHVALADATDEQLQEAITAAQEQLTANRVAATAAETLADVQAVLDGPPELTATKAVLALAADTTDGSWVVLDFDVQSSSADMKLWLTARVEEMVATDKAQIISKSQGTVRMSKSVAIARLPRLEAELT